MNDSMMRFIKGGAAVIALLVLVLLVGRYWGDYREKSAEVKSGRTNEATPTAPVKGESKAEDGKKSDTKDAETPAATKTLQVTIDGLNFRKEPSSESAAIRGLDAGEKLKLLKEQDGWYQVEDSKGTTGWISANPQYTKVVK